MPTLNFLGLPRAYIYIRSGRKKSLQKAVYRQLQSVAYQAVSTTLPEACSSGFVHWFPVWYFLQPRIFTWVPKQDPKVEVQRLVAYHYSPVGGHMGQLRCITTLQATVRLLGYLQAKLRFTKVTTFTASAVEG